MAMTSALKVQYCIPSGLILSSIFTSKRHREAGKHCLSKYLAPQSGWEELSWQVPGATLRLGRSVLASIWRHVQAGKHCLGKYLVPCSGWETLSWQVSGATVRLGSSVLASIWRHVQAGKHCLGK
ncbi:hypothetical protein BgiBS90_022956 [Biomphalaria glabrata]|nr:hypothetical protein BgiBS90_022956 [Biomphalaria glabrata]